MTILIFLLTLGLSLWASARVRSMVHRYSQVPASSGYSGAEVAQHILRAAGIGHVAVVAQDGFLGDHYDPINKRLVLSQENYHGTSTAALGIAAHETGHALQDKVAYAPLRWRGAAVGATMFANQVVTILPFIGMFTGLWRGHTAFLIMAVGWGVIMLFNLVTLPVEFDASRRAKVILGQMGFIRGAEETRAVNQVLDAAALTYVAAFLTSLAYFLHFLLPLLLSDRDR